MAQETPTAGRAGSARPDAQPSVTPARCRPGSAGRSGNAGHKRGTVLENLKGLLWVILIYFFVRTFLVEAYRIPTGSMKPTLLVGDWLFVNKLVFGPHIPFTNASLPGYRQPTRGDVVVFESPYQADLVAAGDEGTPTLVKRLVAIAGDTIYLRNAQLYVNGVAQPTNYLMPNPLGHDVQSPVFGWMAPLALTGTRFGPPPAVPSLDNWGPMVVPPGKLFMMGDNRYDSKDSRFWGFVPRENVRGRPIFVYYSYNAEDSDRPLPGLTDVRWSRIGHIIR